MIETFLIVSLDISALLKANLACLGFGGYIMFMKIGFTELFCMLFWILA